MDITLVTASNSKEVHGTDNDKKTGCGINLLRGENITVYRRIGQMKDLKEITCEKCKANLAKKMIKADKKEMSRMLKEEKQRAKMGMGDEGIVPLGNTTAKITRAPQTYNSPAPQPSAAPVNNYNSAPSAPRPPALSAPPQNTIPGTGVAIDDSLAAFAINKPVAEEQPEPQAAPQDDFMTQFAVQKPAAEEQPAAPAQDDFLAQFAVPTAEQPVQNSFDTYQPEPTPAAPPVIDNVDDILSMFSVDNVASQGVPSANTNPYGAAPAQPAYGAIPAQPVYSTPQPAFDDLQSLDAFGSAPAEPVSLAKDDVYSAPVAPAPQAAPVQAAPQIISVPQLAGYDQSGQPVYNYVQMQMTGIDPNGQPIFTPVSNQQQTAPVQAAPAPQAAPPRPLANFDAPKANVSKIAVNPHAKQTSQAFIKAIASSKEYADKNLIDTQGLVANTPILSSIEDVLSTMGDDSAKQQMLAKQEKAQQEKNFTGFNEYKGPGASNNRRPVPPQFRNTPSQQQQKDPRMMTKSELKAYKKQEKIEAKFKKEMAKRGGF